MFAFTTLLGYLSTRNLLGLTARLADDSRSRDMLVRGVAHAIQVEAEHLGFTIDGVDNLLVRSRP